MSLPRIAVIISTTREGRFSDKPARWIFDLARERNTASFEIIDLRDHPLPFFDEPILPATSQAKHPAAQAWAEKLAGFDAFIFVTAEYNFGVPAVLKNALDYAYPEFNRKPAAFVGYGGVGAARAVGQLRQITVELQMAPVRSAVHIGMAEFTGLQQGKSFTDFPYLGQSAEALLDDLIWWTHTLKAGRDAMAA